MTSKDFLLKLHNPGNVTQINNIEVNDVIKIDNASFNCRGLILQDCTFNSNVSFKDVVLNLGLKLIRCKFNSSLSFDNCTSNGYDPSFNKDSYNIDFNQSLIKQLVFNNVRIQRGLRIHNECIINYLNVIAVRILKGGFDLIDTKVLNDFDIRQSVISGGLSIRAVEANVKLRCENIKCESLSFIRCHFKRDTFICGGQIKSSIIFNDSVFEDSFTLKAPTTNLTIMSSRFAKIFETSIVDNQVTGKMNSIFISRSVFEEEFGINGGDQLIEKIDIHCTSSLVGSINFTSIRCKDFTLLGTNNGAHISINKSKIEKLEIGNFNNIGGTLLLSSIDVLSPTSQINIFDSNLGKSSFYNLDFNSFQKIRIESSIVSQIDTALVTWFEPRKIFYSIGMSKHEIAKRNRELFRQLKTALERHGNRFQALRFRELEFKSFWDELKYTKNRFNQDRIVMWLSSSNDFGQNWIKPSMILLLVTLVFYLVIVTLSSDELGFLINLERASVKYTLGEWISKLDTFPLLFNPVKPITELYSFQPKYLAVVSWIEFFFKVSLTFLLFQIISAFRKYVK